MKKFLSILLILALLLGLAGCTPETLPEPSGTAPSAPSPIQTDPGKEESPELDEHGHYNSKEQVALYIHLYGKLPENYVTKSQCKALGSSYSRVWEVVEDGAIGGDNFQNREGLLPKKDGRRYYECDIDTWGASSRGAKRIVFSNDGLVYYTSDHYASFTLLYGET